MSEPLARREREALCDLVLELGPHAPTCCTGWDTKDLVTHLLVRERSPASVGLVLPPLARLTDRAMARRRRDDLPDLVATLRSPGLVPLALPPLDRAANTAEYFVHHEDVRRARPGWQPRTLSSADEDLLWKHVRMAGRALVRGVGVPVVVVRSYDGRRIVLRRGAGPVVLTGRPSELLLTLFDRPSVDVEVEGPDPAVARFRAARKGF